MGTAAPSPAAGGQTEGRQSQGCIRLRSGETRGTAAVSGNVLVWTTSKLGGGAELELGPSAPCPRQQGTLSRCAVSECAEADRSLKERRRHGRAPSGPCESGSVPSTSAARTAVPWEEEEHQPPAPSTDPGCPGKGAGLCSTGSTACPLVTRPCVQASRSQVCL